MSEAISVLTCRPLNLQMLSQQKVTPDALVVELPDIAAVFGKLAVGAKRTGVPPPLQDLVTFALQPLGDVELFCQCLVVVEQLVGLHIGDVDQLLQVIQDLFMHVHDVTRKKDGKIRDRRLKKANEF